MSIMGVSKEPVGRKGAQSLGGPPLVFHIFPDHLSLSPGHLHVSFPSRHHNFFTVLTHSGHSPPPTRPGLCLSIVRDLPLPGSAACISLFHFLHCSVGRVSSHLCHLLGFRTLLAVFLQVFDAPILAFIALSSSPQEAPVRDDIHPTTQPRVTCPFLFPRSYTHN